MSSVCVSIITVCFNSEKYIEQTIQSVINQSYKNIEYLIIDGGSTDSTLTILKKYAEVYPNIVKYVSEKDTGIYNAMNKGIKMSRGELIGVINSDDWYETTAVECMVEVYKKNGSAIYHGIQRTYKKECWVQLQCTNSSQLSYQMIEHPTCFLPKCIYDDCGLFNESYKYVADYELMLRLREHNYRFVVIEKIIANFREGGASFSFEAVLETYKLWLNLGLISKWKYIYRYNMDQLKYLFSKLKK